MDTILSFLGVVLTPICSVVVVLITVRSERNKKVEELKRAQEKKAQDERDKKIDDQLKALSDKFDEVNTRFDGLDDKITALQQADEVTLKDLRDLSEQQAVYGEYIHELSKIVTVIAEGMRDQHLDGNVTNAVSAFRRFERDKLSQLISKPVIEN